MRAFDHGVTGSRPETAFHHPLPFAFPTVALGVVGDTADIADHPALRGLVSESSIARGTVVQAVSSELPCARPVAPPVLGDAGPLRLVVLVNTPMSIPDKRHVLRQVHDLIGPKGVMVYLPDRNEGLIGSWLMTALKTGFAFAQTMQLPDPVNQCPALVASRRLPICSAGTRLKFS